MFVIQTKYKSFLNIFILQKIYVYIYLLKLRCELNNLVRKVSEAGSLCIP